MGDWDPGTELKNPMWPYVAHVGIPSAPSFPPMQVAKAPIRILQVLLDVPAVLEDLNLSNGPRYQTPKPRCFG